MSIHDYFEKIKPFYFIILSIFIAIIFFALGRLSVIEERKSPIRILEQGQTLAGEQNLESANAISSVQITENSVSNITPSPEVQNASSATTDVQTLKTNDGQVVGSKTGKKYYFPWCGTVKRIKSENQVHFDSVALARSAGYLPGGNCKGLK